MIRLVAQGPYRIGELTLEPGRQLLDGTRIVKIGRKALDLLSTLAAADGGVLTKDDLMAAVWPGLTVEENAIQVHVWALRKALGPEASRLITVHRIGYRLDRNQLAPPLNDDVAGSGNLPAPNLEIIGRGVEIADLERLLSKQRLITLTGCGGIGKTSLAIELSRRRIDDYPGGVWLARLDRLADPSHLSDHILAELGSPVSGSVTPVEQLVRRLTPAATLVVLDNAEHLIGEVAVLAATLLERTPTSTLLVTSRQPLGIAGELVWRTPGLELAEEDGPTDAIRDAPAVKLFRQRMAAVRGGAEPTGEELASAAAICRRLDGLPLAIQLAAARCSHLSPAELLGGLDWCLDLLARGRRTAPPRQQTMSAAIDWSHALLPEAAQILLRRLSVFAGGWTRDALEQIIGSGKRAHDVLDLLATLVETSLVEHEATPAGSRYRLLEVVRSYARKKLEEAQEAAIYARRHAQYFRDLAARAHQGYETASGPAWRTQYASELDNIRAAWVWASSTHGEARLGGELAAYCNHLMMEEGLLLENRRWLGEAAEHLAPDWPPDVAAIIHAGRFLSFMPGPQSTREGLRIAVARAREADEPRLLARCLSSLAISHFAENLERAEALLTTAIDLIEPMGPAKALGISLLLRSEVLQMQGNPMAAERDRARAIELHLMMQDYMPLALALGDRIEARLQEGDLEAALALARDAVDTMRRFQQANRMPRASFLLGVCLLRTGAIEAARDAAREALAEGERATDEPPLYAALILIAALAAHTNAEDAAAKLLGHVAAWRGRLGIRQKAAETNLEADLRDALGTRYPAFELEALLSAGGRTACDDAILLARRIVQSEIEPKG